jgi:photosynthetic reaction center H subunit
MHETGAITGYIDVAQLVLYAFWIFFAGLIFYLHRENKREGFPMIDDRGRLLMGFPDPPKPKAFLLPHGETVFAPRLELPVALTGGVAVGGFAGAPIMPTGNPLLSGIGPAAYADRKDEPERTYDSGLPMVVPLRVATEQRIAEEDPDPRGMEVLGADGLVAGVIEDVWVDRSENMFRYLEMRPSAAPARTVLVPLPFVQFLPRRQVRVRAIRADQFAEVPPLRDPDSITLLEEDKVSAYFGGGTLFAMAARSEPLL